MKDEPVTQRMLNAPEFLVDPNAGLGGTPDITNRLSDSEKDALTKAATICTFAKGVCLFRQGEPHQGIHLINSGKVRTLYTSTDGKAFTLAYWTPGHFVGAPQVLGGGDNFWTSVAEVKTTTMFLKPEVILTLIPKMPGLALGLIDGLAYKAALYAKIAQVVGTAPITARLALLLLSLAEPDPGQVRANMEVRGHQPQERLAMMIGSTRQAVAHTLDRFEKAGLISREGRHIRITNAAGLKDLCSGTFPSRRECAG